MIKKESCTTITTTTRAFSSVKLTGVTASLESVLHKLILLGTVKLRTLGKAAVVAKRVARASCLPSAEPAFNLLIPFSESSFMGVQTPEYHGSDWPANKNAGPMVPEPNHREWGRETSPEARV